uniref:Uncharacterized protein n=1 Tax=Pithovirus LCPAC406 TaxID=2506599 RepID=A0A481ZDD8_9VIRU|nr:MAG: uncharacterized protein LCPAC406_02480 [Pithovirus LCPAC406]
MSTSDKLKNEVDSKNDKKSTPTFEVPTNRRHKRQFSVESELKNDKKLKVKEYVSFSDGTIQGLYRDISLLCYLYENKCDLIKTVAMGGGQLTNIRCINSRYCRVTFIYMLTKQETVLDTDNQILFKIDLAKWKTQGSDSKDWSFCNNDLVIQYVKNTKPESLIVSSLADDEKIITYVKNKEVICLKVKKSCDIFVLC